MEDVTKAAPGQQPAQQQDPAQGTASTQQAPALSTQPVTFVSLAPASPESLLAKAEEEVGRVADEAKVEAEKLVGQAKAEIKEAPALLGAATESVKTGSVSLFVKLKGLLMGVPEWKLILVVALLLLAIGLLAWSSVGTSAPKPAVFIPAAPAVTAPKVAGPSLQVPLQLVPKAAVRKKFGSALTLPADSEVIDTTDIPKAENGVDTVTTMNTTTGTASTVFLPKAAPWFALEDRNTIGAGYEESTEGARVPVYYRRDILRVKDLHLVGEVGGKIPVGAGKVEGHAGAYAEWRF